VLASACDSEGLKVKQWMFSSDCSGSGYFEATEAVGQCIIFSYYQYFENSCGGSADKVVKGAQVRMARKKN